MQETLLVRIHQLMNAEFSKIFFLGVKSVVQNPYYLSPGRLGTPKAMDIISAHKIAGGNNQSWYSIFVHYEEVI
jgi:hypothetical protein